MFNVYIHSQWMRLAKFEFVNSAMYFCIYIICLLLGRMIASKYFEVAIKIATLI